MAYIEEATRIWLFCPVRRPDEPRRAPIQRALGSAVLAIIAHLERQIQVRSWGGFTYSDNSRPAFTGEYWDERKDDPAHTPRWDTDNVVVILIDALAEDTDRLIAYLDALRTDIASIYDRVGEHQMEIWITTQPTGILRSGERPS